MQRNQLSKSTRLKKIARNKFTILLIASVLIFTSVTQKPKEVDAFGLAIPAGITLGAGVYTISALALAAVIGPISPENEQIMKEHAMTVWNDATQLSKDSINWSIAQAQNAGTALQNFGQDFVDWMELQAIPKLASIESGLYTETGIGKTGGSTTGTPGTAEFTVWQASHTMNGGLGHAFLHGSTTYSSLIVKRIDSTTIGFHLGSSFSPAATRDFGSEMALENALKNFWLGDNTGLFLSIFNAYSGLSIGLQKENIVSDLPQIYQQNLSRYREAWESMRDAGLVLPVDGVTGHVGDKIVRYDGQSDTYRDDAGTVYAPNDVTWSFPQPRVRTGEEVAIPGIYVDTPALTGNPAIDETIIGNPAIPKTTTNIHTGTTVANPDIATPKPEVPGDGTNPPGGTTPKPPGSTPIIPVALLLGLFDLLRAILMYLSRMFTFLVTLPFVTAIPIENPYFQWFRTAKILGVQPYPLVMTMATFFMSFAAFKSIRRFLP